MGIQKNTLEEREANLDFFSKMKKVFQRWWTIEGVHSTHSIAATVAGGVVGGILVTMYMWSTGSLPPFGPSATISTRLTVACSYLFNLFLGVQTGTFIGNKMDYFHELYDKDYRTYWIDYLKRASDVGYNTNREHNANVVDNIILQEFDKDGRMKREYGNYIPTR